MWESRVHESVRKIGLCSPSIVIDILSRCRLSPILAMCHRGCSYPSILFYEFRFVTALVPLRPRKRLTNIVIVPNWPTQLFARCVRRLTWWAVLSANRERPRARSWVLFREAGTQTSIIRWPASSTKQSYKAYETRILYQINSYFCAFSNK